ncbi:MAG: glycosyltransferase family 39 protein [Acidobacteria bacterium]|nr:glycosyltransferase family 39 protein [Acidobacteriota bacterium]
MRDTPWFHTLSLDPEHYDLWAQQIAAGDWIGKELFFMEPLYPYFLAVIYKVIGRDFLWVRLIQAAIGVATCGVTALLGRRLFGRTIGNFAGALAALFAPAIFYEAEIDKTFLAVFWVTLSVYLFTGGSRWSRFGSGFALGVATLARGNLLLLVPFALLASIIDKTHEPRSQRLVLAGSFLIGVASILGPVTARNYHVSGQWVITTAHGGQNFYIGNYHGNTTGRYHAPVFVRAHPRFEQEDFQKEAERRLGRKLSALEASSYWFGEGVREIVNHPRWAISHTMRKFALFWNDYEEPDNQDMYYLRGASWVLRLRLVSFGMLVPFAALGLVIHRKRRDVRILCGFLILYCASVVAFFVFSRYRIHVTPVLCVLAASGLAWLWANIRMRRVRPCAYAGLLLLCLGAFTFRRVSAMSEKGSIVQAYINEGGTLAVSGEYGKAIESFQKALAIEPHSDGALCGLGVTYARLERFPQAEANLRACVKANPLNRLGWAAFSLLMEQSGRHQEALDATEHVLRISPGDAKATFRAAELALRLGKYTLAIEKYRAVIRMTQEGRAYVGLIVAQLSAGHLDDARATSKEFRRRGGDLPANIAKQLGE